MTENRQLEINSLVTSSAPHLFCAEFIFRDVLIVLSLSLCLLLSYEDLMFGSDSEDEEEAGKSGKVSSTWLKDSACLFSRIPAQFRASHVTLELHQYYMVPLNLVNIILTSKA